LLIRSLVAEGATLVPKSVDKAVAIKQNSLREYSTA
jgi:hypothetical protein